MHIEPLLTVLNLNIAVKANIRELTATNVAQIIKLAHGFVQSLSY